MLKMWFKHILPFALLNYALLLSAASAQQEPATNNSNDVFIFMPTAVFTLPYYKMHTPDMATLSRKMSILISKKVHVNTVDFHPPSKRIFFTMERIGYWTKNAKIYAMPWDPDFVCEGMFEMSRKDEVINKATGTAHDIVTNLFNSAVQQNSEQTETKRNARSTLVSLDDDDDYDEDSGKRKCKTSPIINMPFYGDIKPADLTLIRNEENWNPRSIAIDYIGNKLYVVVTNEMAVNAYDLNGQNKAIVFRNESVIPLEVALDVNQGLMFVLGYNNKIGAMEIYRANMDGTSALLILENKVELEETQIRERMGFAISTLKKRIYFPNLENNILESLDYEGKGRVTIGKVNHPSSVTAYNDTVYWSEGSSVTKGFACFQPGGCSFWSCQIGDNGSCIDNSTKLFEKGATFFASHSIKAVVTNPSIGSNPCEVDNGGCEHHCLLRHSRIEGSLDSGCVCREGYRLSENLKNCTKTKMTNVYDDFYLQKRTKLTSLSNLSREDVFPISRNLLYRLKFERQDRIFIKSPFTFLEIEENGKSIRENEIAQRDSATSDNNKDSQLFIVGLNVESHKCEANSGDVVVTRSPNGFARVLSYDWVTKNLYYVKLPNSSEEQSVLTALRLELPERICLNNQKPIFRYASKRAVSLAKIPEPVSIMVHPYRGYVFASFRNGSLIRLNTDGSNKITLSNVNNSVLLATDVNDDKIYWMDSDQYLNFANLDGSSSKRLFKSPIKQIKTMEIYDDWVYITDEIKLWRFDKVTGKASGILEDLQDMQQLYRESLGLKVPSKYAQHVDEDHPCGGRNGDCDSLCFEVPVGEGKGELRKVCA